MKPLVFLILCFTVFPSFAKDSLFVAGVLVTIGADEFVIRKKMSAYRLGPSDSSGNTVIFQGEKPNTRIVGHLGFHEGRVFAVSRHWGNDVSTPSDTVTALIGAFQSMLDNEESQVKVSTDSLKSPEFWIDSINFRQGNRRIAINVQKYGEQNVSVAIQETITREIIRDRITDNG